MTADATVLEVERPAEVLPDPPRPPAPRRRPGARRRRVSASTSRQGETLSLVGESGCGKTTTSRCILRAHRADRRRDPLPHRATAARSTSPALPQRELRPLRRQMQMIFQDPFSSLNPRMTIADIIGEPLLVNGMGDLTTRRTRVARAAGRGAAAARLHEPLPARLLAAASASASASRARWRSTRR